MVDSDIQPHPMSPLELVYPLEVQFRYVIDSPPVIDVVIHLICNCKATTNFYLPNHRLQLLHAEKNIYLYIDYF